MSSTIFFQFNGTNFPVDKKNFQNESTHKILEKTDIINFDEFDNVDESIVESFADYFNEMCPSFTVSNVVPLSILAEKFYVETLKHFAKIFKDKHTALLVEDFFKSDRILNFEYEQLIAKVLPSFIDETSLLKFSIPCIYRIIQLYVKDDNSFNMDIINFMFKYFEENGPDSSVIFGLVDKLSDEDEDEFLKKIYFEHKDCFNFCFLKPYHTTYLFSKNLQLQNKITDLEFQLSEVVVLENTIKSLKEDSVEFLTKLRDKIQKRLDYDDTKF